MNHSLKTTVPMVRHSAQLFFVVLALGCLSFITADKAAVQLDTIAWLLISAALIAAYPAAFKAPSATRLLVYVAVLQLIALYLVVMHWALLQGLFGPATIIAVALPMAALSVAAYQLHDSPTQSTTSPACATPVSYMWIRIALACIGYACLIFSCSSMGQFYFGRYPILIGASGLIGVFACYSAYRLVTKRNAAWWGAITTLIATLAGSAVMIIFVAKPTILLPVILLCMALYYLIRWSQRPHPLTH